jgi:hypothetical protein
MKFAVVLVLLAGCSFIGVRGPRDPARPDPDCATSKAAPSVDAGMAGVALATALGSLALALGTEDTGNFHGQTFALTVITLPSLVVGGTYAASASFGFKRVRACREANAGRLDRTSTRAQAGEWVGFPSE